jgi:hypothetical protein
VNNFKQGVEDVFEMCLSTFDTGLRLLVCEFHEGADLQLSIDGSYVPVFYVDHIPSDWPRT